VPARPVAAAVEREIIRRGIPISEVAVLAGMTYRNRRGGDCTQLLRRLGVAQNDIGRRSLILRTDIAVRILDALHIDPVDIGI
jgi:hypothetical protein